jgi:hypothetical protein
MKEKKVYSIKQFVKKTCKYCNQWIRGINEAQALNNLKVHEKTCKQKTK